MKNDDQNRRPSCRKCDIEFEERVRRGLIARYLFFWLPLKRYICLNCLRRYYVLDSRNSHDHVGQGKYYRSREQSNLQDNNIYRLSSSSTGQ